MRLYIVADGKATNKVTFVPDSSAIAQVFIADPSASRVTVEYGDRPARTFERCSA